jgi:hypothetical protein
MLNRKFPVTMTTGGTSQNCQKSLFCIVFFPSKLISKFCNFSMNWDRVKGFSASVTSYPKIDLRPFLAFHMSKIFLGIFSLFEASKGGGCKKPSKHAYMREKVKSESFSLCCSCNLQLILVLF